MKRVYFEDNGQDFLWWDIDNDGVVQDAGPFQSEVWTGSVTDPVDNIEIGEKIQFIDKDGDAFELKYRVIAIEDHGNITSN